MMVQRDIRGPGRSSRRGFLVGAGLLGLSAVMGQGMLSHPARADIPAVAVRGGTLRIGMHGGDYSNTLDPAQAVAAVPMFNLRCIGDTLVEIDETGNIRPRLAQDVSVSADDMTWRLRLRDDVTFHDGRPMTPEDVMATLRHHVDPASGSYARPGLGHVREIRADRDSVTIELSAPDADLVRALSDVRLVIQPAEGLGKGIFTGPYRMRLSEPGVRHVMERHPGYWDDSRGHVDRIELVVINDTALRMAALETGQVHIINRAEPARALQMQAAIDAAMGEAGTSAPSGQLQLHRLPGRGYQGFVMQCTAQPYDALDMRMAFKHVIDRGAILRDLHAGCGVIGQDLPAASLDGLAPHEHDLDRARHHFGRTSRDAHPVVLHVSDIAFPGAVEMANMVRDNAAAMGMTVEIRREEPDTYWAEVWNRRPFSAGSVAGRASTDLDLSAFESGFIGNVSRYAQPDFDARLAELRSQRDQGLRHQMRVDLGRMVHEHAGLIVPVVPDMFDVARSEVRGFVPNPMAGELMGGMAALQVWLEG